MYGNDRNRSPYYRPFHHNHHRFDDPKRSKMEMRPRCLHSSPIGPPSPDPHLYNISPVGRYSPRTPNRSFNRESPDNRVHRFIHPGYSSPDQILGYTPNSSFNSTCGYTPNSSWDSACSASSGKNYGKKHNFHDSHRSSDFNPGRSDNISDYVNSSMLEDPWVELEQEKKDTH